ncbi:FAD:protein FMN transferase [Herbivorax sp. ANBcel31]|uniref:FAD:protein FMN transferase n=1 Tax=Herbivorax sp. ANBcel31 TaxID=3069754 RepID=UPI0027AFE28A|nr:FAD:protein FMN transferase [Herbivorax sp. ANBcel31]MDQ2087124.1 FAD:protein FMN transferase [Herbivorax sp. ANBcel31]
MQINIKKIFICSITCIILFLSVSGCGVKDKKIQKDIFSLNTIINITVYGDEEAEKVLQEAVDRIYEIENRMSATISESDVGVINKNAGKSPVKVHDDTFFVIEKALEYGELTNGAFDVSVYPLVKLWDMKSQNKKIPTKEEISDVLDLVDYEKIKLNSNERTVFLEKEGMAIDLGGIAKGYAVDEVRDVLVKGGVEHALIYMGGDIAVVGKKPEDELWRIGIEDPRYENEGFSYFAVIEGADISVVTSGDYQRYVEIDGRSYHHIFNPYTGYPADSNLMSTSITGRSSIDADVLSTALFVLGIDEGFDMIEKINGIDGIAVTKDRHVYITEGIRNKVDIVKEEYKEFDFID